MLPDGDRALIQIVDAALAEAARRSGPWLACRPGCTECCFGPFAISPSDVSRLRRGFDDLAAADPDRATRMQIRAAEWINRNSAAFPGNPETGILSDDEAAFDGFANDEPCPALDPATGLCDLYEARPMTCRLFGPPVRTAGAIGVCELCFNGATEAEIAACAVDLDLAALEGQGGETVVAYCLAGASHKSPGTAGPAVGSSARRKGEVDAGHLR